MIYERLCEAAKRIEAAHDSKTFSDYEEFATEVGLTDQLASFEGVGIKPDNKATECSFDIARLAELARFCDVNPEYHIVTLTSDSDDEGGVWEEAGLATDEDYAAAEAMNLHVYCTTMANFARVVNRSYYMLAHGKQDEFINLVEIEIEKGE